MNKILVIAVREYLAVVRSKAFIISLVLLPLMMFAPTMMERLTSKVQDVSDRRFAVIDRTPGHAFLPALRAAVEKRNKEQTVDPTSGRQIEPNFVIEPVEPEGEDAD